MAKSDNVSTPKGELLGNLYALRAGMSTVSQERDIILEIKNKCEKDCWIARKNATAKINEIKNNLKFLESRVTDKKEELKKTVKSANAVEYYRKELKKNRIWAALYILLSIVLMAYLVGFYMIVGLADGSPGFLENIKWAKQDIKESLQAKDSIPNLENELAELEEKRTTLENALSEAMKNEEDTEAACVEMYNKAKAEAEPHIVNMQNLIKALEESFDKIIDTRDWGNIDLFIFALETRRAEDIKEAFDYVDNERRTDRLVKSIEYATKQITMSIDDGLRSLSGDLRRGFELVTHSVAELGSGIERLSGGIENQSNKLSQLVDEQRLNNALVEKASKSSLALAEDVKKIRYNSDYADWQLRINN